MNLILVRHNSVTRLSVFVTANMRKKRFRSICKESTNNNSPGRFTSDDLPGNMKTLDMRPTEVIQDGIRITQEHPDNVVIEMNGSSITLTAENTELLRVILYEAYRSKRWKSSRTEKSARNKALWTLAKAQGKKKPDAQTEKAYERMKSMAGEVEVSNVEVIIPDFDFPDIPDFLKL